jgi:hypothetical protein
MDDREYWTRQLREPERALEAATQRSDVNAAAKRLQLVKAELRRLEQKEQPKSPGRSPKRAAAIVSGASVTKGARPSIGLSFLLRALERLSARFVTSSVTPSPSAYQSI